MLRVALAWAVGLAVLWGALVVALLVARPRGELLREAVRLLPDTLVLMKRLATDAQLGRAVRVRVWLLFAYLAMPFDLVPDFIPVLGYADDAIVMAIVLRGIVRRAGIDAVRRHWPGSEAGFGALCRALGLGGGGAGSTQG